MRGIPLSNQYIGHLLSHSLSTHKRKKPRNTKQERRQDGYLARKNKLCQGLLVDPVQPANHLERRQHPPRIAVARWLVAHTSK